MKTVVFGLFSLLSLGVFAQETTEITENTENTEEFIPIEVEGKQAFISTKTGEYTYRAHAKTDATQLKTTASGVIYADITMHTVKKDETLSSIAKKNGVTITDLKQHNKVTASNLKLGSQLKVVKKMLVKSSSPVKGTSGEERIIARLRPGETPGALAPPPPMEEIQKNLVKTEKTREKPLKKAYKVKKDIKNPIMGLGNANENTEVEKVDDISKKQRLAKLRAEMKALEKELEQEVVAEEIKDEVVEDLSPYNTADEEIVEEVELRVEKTEVEPVAEYKTETIINETKIEEDKEVANPVVKEENGKKVMVFENKPEQKDDNIEETTAEKASRLINEVRKTNAKSAEVKEEKESIEKGEASKIESENTEDSDKSKEMYYTVVKGNSLWSIARKYNMNVDELKKLNNLKNNNLDIGQKLKVKPGSKK